jgi:hypothetical protein
VTTFGSKPLSESTSRAIYGERQRQDRGGVRLDDHRVPVARSAKNPEAVPRRKRAATDDEPDAARHDAGAFHLEARSACGFPIAPSRECAPSPATRGDRFETAILRVRSAGLNAIMNAGRS